MSALFGILLKLHVLRLQHYSNEIFYLKFFEVILNLIHILTLNFFLPFRTSIFSFPKLIKILELTFIPNFLILSTSLLLLSLYLLLIYLIQVFYLIHIGI